VLRWDGGDWTAVDQDPSPTIGRRTGPLYGRSRAVCG